MSLVKQVKVGNITNLSEARYCAGMGVDYLSFPTAGVDPKTFKEITGWVSGPKFGIETESNDVESIELYAPDFVVVSIHDLKIATSNKLVVKLNTNDLPLHREELILQKQRILFIELDFENPTFRVDGGQSIVDQLKEDFQIFVKSDGREIEKYLNLPIDGISLEGNAEDRPGLKEYPLADVLEKLEVVD
jgi:phosphoribosylanthranilate isomerase